MNITILTLLNALNCYLFWYMWNGFYWDAGFSGIFLKMTVYQLLGTGASFGFFVIRNTSVALKLAPANIPDHQRAASAKLAASVGAYAFSLTNHVVALGLLIVNGSIDIWASGNAI